MTDLIERMKQVLKSSDELEALQLLPEAIREIEELRATIKGKTFTVLSDDGEAWKARADLAQSTLDAAILAAKEEGFWIGRSTGGSRAEIDAAFRAMKDTQSRAKSPATQPRRSEMNRRNESRVFSITEERLREIAAMGQGEEQEAAIMGVMVDLVKQLSRLTGPKP